MPKLTNWFITSDSNPYLAPELITSKLVGVVTGHDAFTDGEMVVTSPIVGSKGDLIITKSGTLYELGEVDREYENKYPGARERVLKAIKS